MIINRATLLAANTGFKVIFNNAFSAAASDYEKLAMVVPSSTAQETYAWLGSTTRFREWVGDRVIQNLGTHDFTIKNKSFEATIGVSRDTIEDDSIGVYTPLFQQLGQEAKTHPDELVFALLKAGFATKCYDGQYFFDTDHPVIGADGAVVSVSNMQAGSGAPWYLLDATKAVKPIIFQKRRDYQFIAMDQLTDEAVFSRKEFRYGVDARANVGFGLWQVAYASKADLTADNLNAAIAAMQSLKGDNGKPLNIRPSLLVVPPQLRAKALTLVKAETIESTTNINRDVVDVLSTSWLA
ncbi:Major head subunit [uncultured Alphaproteobacteria bacterium]|uniref:Major head subunit n=1 Tax=uncultured Alphaproteobacteria bacterium TaxID=91750 RepID=A0A212KMY9_9PROT|nr:Major head subunit [uncultured Alphaproteobacteria bacterium]